MKNPAKFIYNQKCIRSANVGFCVGPCSTEGRSFIGSLNNIPTIYIDGGIHKQQYSKNTCHISIGDGDSADCSHDMDILLPADKDYSDLKAGLDLFDNASLLILEGFLGNRRDHELITFGEVYHWIKNHHKYKTAVTFEDKVWCIKGDCHIFYGDGLFSLIAFDKTAISLTGDIKFPIEEGTILNSVCSHGLSNIAFGRFTVSCNKPIFLMAQRSWPQRYEKGIFSEE